MQVFFTHKVQLPPWFRQRQNAAFGLLYNPHLALKIFLSLKPLIYGLQAWNKDKPMHLCDIANHTIA